jgi:hypothetical protein
VHDLNAIFFHLLRGVAHIFVQLGFSHDRVAVAAFGMGGDKDPV